MTSVAITLSEGDIENQAQGPAQAGALCSASALGEFASEHLR